jgi:hypothetical protein
VNSDAACQPTQRLELVRIEQFAPRAVRLAGIEFDAHRHVFGTIGLDLMEAPHQHQNHMAVFRMIPDACQIFL